MLDLGANVDCTPEHLRQFAIMGAALSSALTDKPRPTVALLNIGEEEIRATTSSRRSRRADPRHRSQFHR